LGIFFQQKIDIVGCGRTDAGVHGRHYGFHFEAETDFDEQQFIYKINKLLPDDISINEITKVADNFHARFSAVSRSYIYRIHTFKSGIFLQFGINASIYDGFDDETAIIDEEDESVTYLFYNKPTLYILGQVGIGISF